jgi:hypothetical protein
MRQVALTHPVPIAIGIASLVDPLFAFGGKRVGVMLNKKPLSGLGKGLKE